MADLPTKVCNIPLTFFSRLSFAGGGNSFYEWCRIWICVFFNYVYFFAAQISENCALFQNYGSSLSLRYLPEPFRDDILDIWTTCLIVNTKWAYPEGKYIWQAAYWSKKTDSCNCVGPGEPRDLPSDNWSFRRYDIKCVAVHWYCCKSSCGSLHWPFTVAKRYHCYIGFYTKNKTIDLLKKLLVERLQLIAVVGKLINETVTLSNCLCTCNCFPVQSRIKICWHGSTNWDK